MTAWWLIVSIFIFSDDVDSELLTEYDEKGVFNDDRVERVSSDLSLYRSLLSPSGLSSSLLMNVPLEILTSLMKICARTCYKIVVTTHLSVLLDFSMLPTDGLGVEIAVVRSRDGAVVCLSTDIDTLVGEVDVFTKESALRGHKYRARKAARIAVDVATIVVVIAVVGAEKSGMSSC